jgi:ABC-type enterobactin transport system permease subunit
MLEELCGLREMARLALVLHGEEDMVVYVFLLPDVLHAIGVGLWLGMSGGGVVWRE